MRIEILGAEGCPTCTALLQETINIVCQMQVLAGVDKVTDKAVIESYGNNALPGFVINGKLKASGRLPSKSEIMRWIGEEVSD